jgi:hypothetical protein
VEAGLIIDLRIYDIAENQQNMIFREYFVTQNPQKQNGD